MHQLPLMTKMNTLNRYPVADLPKIVDKGEEGEVDKEEEDKDEEEGEGLGGFWE